MLLFLRNLRATVIVAISLPLSIFPAFWVMDMLGFSLNLVSFLAITLSTGILVDDAIVEIENIVRHMRMGKSPYQAAIEAADEIGLAVIAISLTIVAIFAPASFMSGIAGQFFKQFGITVSVQVLFSLLAARLVTPMLAAYFLKHHKHRRKAAGTRAAGLYAASSPGRCGTTSSPWRSAWCIFAASIVSITLLSQGFLPAQDTARSLLAIELPPGSRLSDTEKVTEDIVTLLRARPEVSSVFVDGGRVPQGATEVRRASLIINYTPKSKNARSRRRNLSCSSPGSSRMFPTSATGSSTRTDCARSRWWWSAPTPRPSPTSAANWRTRCGGFRQRRQRRRRYVARPA